MNRLPSGEQVRYKFVPPKPSRFWNGLLRGYRRKMTRKDHNLVDYEFEEVGKIRSLMESGARLLIAPNHTDHADGLALYELADELDTMFCYMATHQLFEGPFGLRYFFLPRCGVFPVDREGSALSALKAAKAVLTTLPYPLVVYPEGEVYHTNDRLTPLREGTAAMALTAQKSLKDKAPVYVVPVAIKYRYLDPSHAMEAMAAQLDALEQRFTWSAHPEESLPRRIYRFGSGLLALKEVEFLGAPSSGEVFTRVSKLRDQLLEKLEDQHLGKTGSDDLPERVNAVHRRLLDVLKDEEASEEEKNSCRRDLNVLFQVVQLFSYPGDYVQECPTVERIAETLIKFEQDLAGGGYVTPVSPRKLIFRVGEPIDMRDYVGERSRTAATKVTEVLSERLQGTLDEIGVGTLVTDLKSNAQ